MERIFTVRKCKESPSRARARSRYIADRRGRDFEKPVDLIERAAVCESLRDETFLSGRVIRRNYGGVGRARPLRDPLGACTCNARARARDGAARINGNCIARCDTRI